MAAEERKFGRITVDQRGISRRKMLFFGKPFDLSWTDLEGWAVTEALLASPTGNENLVTRIVELHGHSGLEIIQDSDAGRQISQLIQHLRAHHPDKEKRSWMEMTSNGSAGALAYAEQFFESIRGDLNVARMKTHATAEDNLASLYDRVVDALAQEHNLVRRQAGMIVFWFCEKHEPSIAAAVKKRSLEGVK